MSKFEFGLKIIKSKVISMSPVIWTMQPNMPTKI